MPVLASVYFASCEVKPAETVRDIDIVMCSESTQLRDAECAASYLMSRFRALSPADGRNWTVLRHQLFL